MSRFGKRLLSIAVLMLLGVLFGMQLAGSNFHMGNPAGGTSTVVTTEPTPSVTESVPAAPVQKEVKEPPFVPVQSQAKCLGQMRVRLPLMCWQTKRLDYCRISHTVESSGWSLFLAALLNKIP